MKKGFVFGFVGTLVKFIFPYKIVYACKPAQIGAQIVCANHLSYIDFFFIRDAVSRDVAFMAKKELFRFRILNYFGKKIGVIPVNRDKTDITAVKRSLSVLKNGGTLGIFPEGTRAAKNPEKKYHDGVGMLAIRTKSPVIPIRLVTKNERVRPFRRTTVYVGAPVDLSGITDYAEASAAVMKAIYSLGDIK